MELKVYDGRYFTLGIKVGCDADDGDEAVGPRLDFVRKQLQSTGRISVTPTTIAYVSLAVILLFLCLKLPLHPRTPINITSLTRLGLLQTLQYTTCLRQRPSLLVSQRSPARRLSISPKPNDMATSKPLKFEVKEYTTSKSPAPASPSASIILISPTNTVLLLHRRKSSSLFPQHMSSPEEISTHQMATFHQIPKT